MEALRGLKERRSVRAFKDEEIPLKDLEEIVDCARLAPTANNKQPWSFIVVRDEGTLEELGEVCSYGSFIAESSACIIVLGEPDEKYFLEDGCAATENILLAAKAKGYGGCWVAGHGKDYAGEALGTVNASGKELVSVIPLGRPVKEPDKKGKKELDEVMYLEELED